MKSWDQMGIAPLFCWGDETGAVTNADQGGETLRSVITLLTLGSLMSVTCAKVNLSRSAILRSDWVGALRARLSSLRASAGARFGAGRNIRFRRWRMFRRGWRGMAMSVQAVPGGKGCCKEISVGAQPRHRSEQVPGDGRSERWRTGRMTALSAN
jgi:hypothetical protein